MISIVPTTNTTIINKTIVYSDTVLNLKELGSNLNVTTLSNVSEFELERCLTKIFESNKDVTFNTIQYSKSDKKVYFYTDKVITIKAWNDSKIFKYKPITNKKEILEELKEILNYEKSKDPDLVSLKHVYRLLYDKNESYTRIKKTIETRIDDKLKCEYGDGTYCVIYDFDYDNNIMSIGFRRYRTSDVERVGFAKENGDLHIIKSERRFGAEDYLVLVGSELSELYDKFLSFKNYRAQNKQRILAANSNFKVNIFPGSVSINDGSISHEFELEKRVSSKDYDYECNSYEIISLIKGYEDKLFDNIYIKISDCPMWMQEAIKNERYSMLVKESEVEKEQKEKARLEELERKKQEEKQQKRLALKRKFFPWIK